MAFRSVEVDNDLMKKGEYEVYVKDCCFSETKNGTECIKFEFVVRPDVEQPYQNKHKFKQFYRDSTTGGWPEEKIGKYANALGIPKGEDFELEDLIGRSCVMVINHYQDEKTGETKNCIFFLKAGKAGSFVSDQQPGFSEMEDDDGDLPF